MTSHRARMILVPVLVVAVVMVGVAADRLAVPRSTATQAGSPGEDWVVSPENRPAGWEAGWAEYAAGGLLVTSNRTALRICVQGLEGLSTKDQTEATDTVRDIVPNVLRAADHAERFRGLALIVEDGCPRRGLHPLIQGVDNFAVVNPVAVPSPTRLYVFVAPQELIDDVTKSWTGRLVAEELACLGLDCSEVTTGLYVGDREVLDVEYFTDALGKGLGLLPWALPPDHPARVDGAAP